MTGEELAALPEGTIIKLYGDEGEILKAGRECWIGWPEQRATSIVCTESSNWQLMIADMEPE